MDKTALYSKLRSVYGISSSIYSDAFLDQNILEPVLLKVSEYFPAKELASLMTVVDQTRYVVSHDDLIKIDEIFYCQSSVDGSNIWGDSSIVINGPNFNVSTFYSSQLTELIARLKLMKSLTPSEGKVVSYNSFDLFPTPIDNTTKVYYEYSRVRQIAEIPDILLDEVARLFGYYIGEKSVQEQLLDPKGNRYLFDRRGNIMGTQNTHEIMQKSREKQLTDIEVKIRQKTMLMK